MIKKIVVGFAKDVVCEIISNKHSNKKEASLEAKRIQREAFRNRPELQIIDYKNYIERVKYGTKQKSDIDLFVAHISNVTVDGNKEHPIVNAHYRIDDFNPDEWCCVIYTLKKKEKHPSPN